MRKVENSVKEFYEWESLNIKGALHNKSFSDINSHIVQGWARQVLALKVEETNVSHHTN